MTIGKDDSSNAFDTYEGNKVQKSYLLKEKAMTDCIENGVYSTLIKENSKAKVATRADYFGMRPGDNIYFFFNRCIYGIGEIIDIDGTCCFYNYPDAPLYGTKESCKLNPFFCLFKPSPFFFKNGVDMDDILMSNPDAFRKLRFFHARSFIQLDDIENTALKSYIVQKNENILTSFSSKLHYNSLKVSQTHEKIKQCFLSDRTRYSLKASDIFSEGVKVKKYPNRVSSEFYVEGLVLDYVKTQNRLLGYWDFMSRQYPASPNKPAEYADNMDLFGYRYVQGYRNERIISKYIVIEVKSQKADEDTILQIMKYVDWICKEFAHHDYSMIEAYILAYEADDTLLTKPENLELYTRNFIESTKHNANRGIEVKTGTWHALKFIPYQDILKELTHSM